MDTLRLEMLINPPSPPPGPRRQIHVQGTLTVKFGLASRGLDSHGEAGVFHLHYRLPVTHLIPTLMVWQLEGACPYESAGFAIWDG